MVVEQDRKEEIRGKLTAGRKALLEVVESLSAEELAQQVFSDGGTWTAKDLIGHVAYAEASMLVLITRTLEGRPVGPNRDFDLARFNDGRVQRAKGQSVEELLERLVASRQETLALLERVAESDLDRPSYHPALQETTIEGIFKVIGFHERMHAKDLRGVRGQAEA